MASTAIRVTFINLYRRFAVKEQNPVILVLMLITGRAGTAEQGESLRLLLKTDASFFGFGFFTRGANLYPMRGLNEPVPPFLLKMDESFQHGFVWRSTFAVLTIQKIPDTSKLVLFVICCASMRKHKCVCLSTNTHFLIFRMGVFHLGTNKMVLKM